MDKRHASVLVVEDDPQIRKFIRYTLEQEGFSVATAGTAQGALEELVTQPADIMLLDLGLPDFDGMDVINKLREWSEIPVIVVSARDQDKEKAAALDLGADDYITKPFSATELMARIRVALRHLDRRAPGTAQDSLAVGGLRIEPQKRLAFLEGGLVHLTPMEYELLLLLLRNMGKVLTTGYIIRNIWGVGYGPDTQALRTLMAGLRRKIEANPAKPRYIVTEIGVGYRLADE